MLHNLLTSQLWQQGGIIALLKWDRDLFENVTFPEGIDKETAIDYILMNAGKTPLVHPDPEYMKYYLGTWSRVRAPIWEKLLAKTKEIKIIKTAPVTIPAVNINMFFII